MDYFYVLIRWNISYSTLLEIFGRVIVCFPPCPGGSIIGFFFHRIASEYRVHYFITSVVTNFWREVSLESIGPLFGRYGVNSPTILNGSLHWIVEHKTYINALGIHSCENTIMAFKMDTEVFFYHSKSIESPNTGGGGACITRCITW